MALNDVRTPATQKIHTEPADYRFKAFPSGTSWLSLAEIPEQDWNALSGDFSLPVMVLKEAELNHNIERMAAWCNGRGVLLAPHAKTTMSPELVRRQIEAGAWAVTVATVSQARVLAEFGMRRIIIANQVLARADLEWICAFLRGDVTREVYVLVDSLAGVRLMDEALSGIGEAGRSLPVLLELGYNGGRAGCRTTDEALAVASAISSSAHLELFGVEGFEGLVPGETAIYRLIAARAFLAAMTATVLALHNAGLLPSRPMVTSGGSAYFDEVVREFVGEWQGPPISVVLRSGCYITHDHGLYETASPLRDDADPFLPALEVWAHVLSVPATGLAILGCGRRDVPYDAGMPVPLRVRNADSERGLADAKVTSLNDQHLFLSFSDENRLAVGELVCLGISHPCSAFDKWPLIPLVDDSYQVVGAVKTYF
ncbi:D-serine deaminase [Arthrobacter sp. 9V]|uniref:alanine racemase n=1 Tax=Arthrobacter sp. 9V TaxID=2653132 RepID=UPI0012F224B0|nr:alanine racemase [Arthrobacter sp. 9V]VXB51165.1 D-serine deaminase [Arthrobacter sp. 9V]